MQVESVDWGARRLLVPGGYGLIYEVAPGVVAKVGSIHPLEFEIQRFLSEKGLAVLPALNYQYKVDLPEQMQYESCKMHGFYADPDNPVCECPPNCPMTKKRASILLMPKADIISESSPLLQEAADFTRAFGATFRIVTTFEWDPNL